ncbi:hypothetical protein M5D96_003287, partial [Drosophila gunungcola]
CKSVSIPSQVRFGTILFLLSAALHVSKCNHEVNRSIDKNPNTTHVCGLTIAN